MTKRASRFSIAFCAATIVIGCQSATAPTATSKTSPAVATTSGMKASTTVESGIGACKTALGTPGIGQYEVVITLSGIGLFERRDADGVIKVRMPNGAAGRPEVPGANPTDPPQRHAIEPHVAYILADVTTAKPLIDADVPLHPAFYEGNCYQYYPLKGHVITVDAASAPMTINSPLCLTDADDGKLCPSAATKGSMRWLPSIKTVTGAAQSPRPDHFDDDPEPSVLAGLVHVDRGYLETVVTLDKVWAFRNSEVDTTEYTPQAIAQEVRWHMRGTGTHFNLLLKRKGGSQIVLPFAPVNGKVEIFIANGPADATGPIRTVTTSPDHHFPLYYEFIENFAPQTGRIPFRAAQHNCQTGHEPKENPTLQVCQPHCPPDPNCPPRVVWGQPLPSGLNCGGALWP